LRKFAATRKLAVSFRVCILPEFLFIAEATLLGEVVQRAADLVTDSQQRCCCICLHILLTTAKKRTASILRAILVMRPITGGEEGGVENAD